MNSEQDTKGDDVNLDEVNSANPLDNCFLENTVGNLTNGLLEIYKPRLEDVRSQLQELTVKQKVLVEQLHNENLKLAWSQNSAEYQDMFKKIHIYRDKLLNVKREMRALHERSTKLKKRALKLQQTKEKEEAAKLLRRQKEQELIAK